MCKNGGFLLSGSQMWPSQQNLHSLHNFQIFFSALSTEFKEWIFKILAGSFEVISLDN